MDEVILRNYLLPFGSALSVCVILTYFIRQLAVKLKVFDWPTEARKIHLQPAPELGGLALYFTFTLILMIFQRAGFILDGRITAWQLVGLTIGGGWLMIGGYFDDKYRKILIKLQ